MKNQSLIIKVFVALSLLFPSVAAQNKQNADLFVENKNKANLFVLSPSNKILASNSTEPIIILWSVETGRQLQSIQGHSEAVISIAFSPDGKILASGSLDTTIKLWSIETGQQIGTFSGHTGSVGSVVFSRDGKTLFSGSNDKTVKLWNIATGLKIKSLNIESVGNPGEIELISFSPDEKTVAFSLRENLSPLSIIEIWDIEIEKRIKSFQGHPNKVYSIAFSPDGKTLFSVSLDSSIKLWSIKTGQQIKSVGGYTDFDNSVAFSPDGNSFASTIEFGTIKLRSLETGREIKSIQVNSSIQPGAEITFSPSGTMLISKNLSKGISLWDIQTGQEIKTFESSQTSVVEAVSLSPDGGILVAANPFFVKLWSLETGQVIKSLREKTERIFAVSFSPDGKTLATWGSGNNINLWNVESGEIIKTFEVSKLFLNPVWSVAFSPDGKKLASGHGDKTVKLWEVKTGLEIKFLKNFSNQVTSVIFSPDGKILASESRDSGIILWNLETGEITDPLEDSRYLSSRLDFSPDGKTLVSGTSTGIVKLWDIETRKQIKQLKGHTDDVYSVKFSPDGKFLATGGSDNIIKIWKVETGQEVKSLEGHLNSISSVVFTPNGKLLISGSKDGTMKIWDFERGENIASLISLDENDWMVNIASLISFDKNDWIVTTPEGRFDTNKSLDNIEGLHWIVNDEILNPLPLDIFMRQYYEPGLLQRVLKCNEEDNCAEEFKPLPSIVEINRVQPKVVIKEINLVKNASGLADVTVEVESVSEDVSVSSDDRSKKKRETSGVFDLRLFRDGQLVGVSTPKEKLEPFIKDAPNLIKRNEEEFKKTGKLTDTPEDKAWREANDMFALRESKNVKIISPNKKLEYTFRNIKLPKDGKKEEIEFTAYAFNEAKVKSATTEPKKFTIPKEFIEKPKKGRAVLVSIGVNKSETSQYNLRYAANDARKMQEIIGGKLDNEEGEKYSEFIGIELISDDKAEKHEEVNTAQKEVIKSVFSLMSGEGYEEVLAEIKKSGADLAKEFESIPNIKRLRQIEPEDTLIISFSGHGVADNSGIFYLLPYDIGENVTKINTDVLSKTISSDELSLWMQDITAAEMIMIIDACYSSSAVGADFKPGPMGSRGLGQLAYDKDMKILSATQANNVALELNTLEQGFLSYALLQDGIVERLADADKDKQLLSTEWLEFAEKRVPKLYTEVKDGKRGAIIDGKNFKPKEKGVETFYVEGDQKSSLNLQQPKTFDFKRRKKENTLFILP